MMIPFVDEYVSMQAFAIYMSSCLFCVVAVGFSCYSAYVYYLHKRYLHIPGPKRDGFFAGNVPSIQLEIGEKKRGICELWFDWYKEFGGAFVFWVYHVPVVVVGDPDDAKKVLITWNLPKAGRIYNSISYCYGERMAGEGLLTELNHEVWKRKRAMLNHAFHRKYLMNLMEAFNASCDVFLKKIGKVADEKTEVRMADEFAKVTLDIIGKVGFNINTNVIENPNSPFPSAISTSLKGAQQNVRDPFWMVNFWTFTYQNKVKKAIRSLRKFAENVIGKRTAATRNGEQTPKDILAHILEMSEQNPSYSMKEMADDFVTFFVAGQETTSSHLSFTLLEILSNPHIEQKVCKEVEEILGSRKFVEYEDLGKFAYVGMNLKEGLRLHPPITNTQRILPVEDYLGGYRIPAKTPVNVVYFITHRVSECWKDPELFDPERFSDERKGEISSCSFLPFCAGPRTCIGKTLAEFEAKLLMVRLLQEFKLELVPGQSARLLEQLTVRPRDGVICTITRR